MPYKLRVLGSPDVLDEGGKPVSLSLGKPLALLIYVASNPSPVSRDELADLFWPDADRQKGRHSVRQALWVLKNALGEEIFETDDPLSISQSRVEIDLHVFLDALAMGRVEDARPFWRGPVLEHFGLAGARGWNRWAEDLRADVERRFSAALLLHARELANGNEPDEALSALEQAIEVAPSAQGPHLARINLFLDLLRLDRAREALADAQHALGDREDALRQLAALEARLDRVALEQRIQVGQGDAFPMEFVGRSREMAALQGLWRETNQGRSRVAVISGPSGIGKSRLAQEVLAYLPGEDTQKVSIRGTRGERKLRWGAASDLVRQLLRLPGSAAISIASDSLLRAMLPSMGREPTTPHPTNGINPAAVLDAAMDLLESVTFESPLAVLIDDLQWVDPESRTLFMGLANRARELRVLFLFLGRSELSSRHWEDLEQSLMTDAGARRFLLEPLIEEEVGELLALSATFQDSEDAAKVVTLIHQSSAGNPLFIRAILEELQEQGALRREEAGWVFEASALPEEFELPENIRNLLKERLDRMSEAGATVAATLARESRSLSAEALRAQTQLPTNVFTQALAELLERGVVEWTDGTRLDFVHDLLREAAASHLSAALPQNSEGSERRSGTRALLILAAGILLALPMGILWGSGNLPWRRGETPPPYGGGIILFHLPDGRLVGLEPGPGSPDEWVPTEVPTPSKYDRGKLFRRPGGGVFWSGIRRPAEGPDMIQILDDNTEVPLFPAPGDQALMDLFPDGSRILFVSENVGSAIFSKSLYRGWMEDGRQELIHRGAGWITSARWSPDGDFIAFIASGPQDTLSVLSRQKERLGSFVEEDIQEITWCGSSLVAAVRVGQQGFFLKLAVPSMEVDTVARIEPGARPACSPDGTALVYTGVLDRHLVPILMEMETGELHPLSLEDTPVGQPTWLPEVAPTVPTRIQIEPDRLTLSWGDEARLSASVLYSDGSRSSEGIRWESMDPGIAAVDTDGHVTANGAGPARVVAGWGYSLRDTILVNVEFVGAEGSALREDFRDLDTIRWIPMGLSPRIDDAPDGEPALRIEGREKYADGLVLSSPVSLDQGITVEMEFIMNPNRPVHQNVGICILDMEPDREVLRTGDAPAEVGVCVHYPAQELDKFDPSEAYVVTIPGRFRYARIPEVLPSDDWTHLAVQVRADGEATLVVNRERITSNPVVIPTRPRARWTVVLSGDAIGTDLFVRNLTVWPGERY